MKRTYYNPQPQMALDTSINNTARQPFNIEYPQAKELTPLSKDSCFTLCITMLFVIATMAGFAYINMYLTFDLYKVVVAGQPGTNGTTPDNCTMYYCDDSAHYYVHNYAAYDKCNLANCAPVCTTYDCSNPSLDNSAYYYDCYTGCTSAAIYTNKVFPPQLYITFIVASVGGCLFTLAVLVSFLYGIVAQCTNSGLGCFERLALLFNVISPSGKYYAVRSREDWEDAKINLKAMLWVDIFVTFLIALALACYIYIAIAKAFLFYEYLVTFGMGLMLMAYAGNLHRNYIELSEFQQKLEAIRSR